MEPSFPKNFAILIAYSFCEKGGCTARVWAVVWGVEEKRLTKDSKMMDTEDYQSQWKAVRQSMRDSYGEMIFQHWLAPLGFSDCQSKVVTLKLSSPFIRDWVVRNYAASILAFWQKVHPGMQSVRVVLSAPQAPQGGSKMAPQSASRPSSSASSPQDSAPEDLSAAMQPRAKHFSNFLIGESNRLAAAAAQNFAEMRNSTHNPLYLYGSVGLGKTHLLCAIADFVRKNQPSIRIQHLSCERFMTQMAQAFATNKALESKMRLRDAELLLIDDVHFLTGARMQNELQHMVDSFLSSGGRVALTACKAPARLGLQDSLRSRFSAGLTVEIGSTDRELRLNILHAKAAEILAKPFSSELPDVLAWLAEHHRGGVREMEGALRNVANAAEVLQKKITLSLVQDTLRDVLHTSHRYLGVEDIQYKVCQHYKLKLSDLLSRRRMRVITHPRHVAMYLCKHLTSSSFPEIGQKFGGKDHATVIHAVRKIEALRREDSKLDAEISQIEEALAS